MDSVDNFVVPKQNPVGLEGPRMELRLYFMCKDMEKDARWTEGEGEHHACTIRVFLKGHFVKEKNVHPTM